jgi:hypothetical protein
MSPARQLAKGILFMIVFGFLAKGSGAIIFGFCKPTSKLCAKAGPSFWMYAVFGASLFLLLGGVLNFLSAVSRTRTIIKTVYRKEPENDMPPHVGPATDVEPEKSLRFLPFSFESNFRAFLCDGRYDAARALLAGFDAHLDPKLRNIISNACNSGVRVEAWEAANNFIAATEKQHGKLTAIGIDISEHNGYAEHAEPAIELNLFDDSQFSFSTHTIAAIAAEANQSNGPHWQGCFFEICNESLRLSGLADLHHTISFELGDALSNDKVKVAEYWRRLLFEEAVVVAVKSGELHFKVPVIIGTHDLAPFMASVVNSQLR